MQVYGPEYERNPNRIEETIAVLKKKLNSRNQKSQLVSFIKQSLPNQQLVLSNSDGYGVPKRNFIGNFNFWKFKQCHTKLSFINIVF